VTRLGAGEHRVGLAASEEDCLSIIDTIDEHHGEYGHNPPLTVVEVFGAKATEKVRVELAAVGFRRLEPSPSGFVAFRDPV
jgi:hypothetical protein